MSLFDIFGKKKPGGAIAKHAARLADKRSMTPDRWEAIQALIKIDSEEAIEAMLPRFTYYGDPTITDHEEKETIFNAIIAKKHLAEAPLRRFIAKAESVSWPLKALERILPAEEVLKLLIELLSKMDTEYERDPQRKLQILAELEQRTGDGILAVVQPFFEDVNETARFHALGAALAQPNAVEAEEALRKALAREDSMRVKAKVLEGFAKRGWSIEPGAVGKLPDGWYLDAGLPKRR